MAKKRKGAQKISRNKKSYWKKGADVTDIEEHAANQRENERLGLNKSDADLFFYHKTGFGGGQDGNRHGYVEKVELKCFQNLKPDSAVPGFKEQKLGSCITKRKQEKRLEKLRKIAATQTKKRARVSKSTRSYDLWQDKKSEFPFLSPDVEQGYLRATKKLLPKVPDTFNQIITKLPAIEFPHPGQSYNPTFDDHQKLLKQAAEVETKKNLDEERLLKSLKLKGEPANSATNFAELVEGLDLFKTESNKNLNEDESDEEKLDGNKNVTEDSQNPDNKKPVIDGENRKLSKIRRRELIEKLKKEQKLKDKLTKKRLNDVFRVKSLLKEIKEDEKQTNEKILKKFKRKEENLLKPSTLSRHKYEESDMPVNLSSEIGGSLRLLKPEGSLIEDRFKSLQRRNIIETRALYLKYKRKYPLKKYEIRDSHKITVDYVPR